MPLAKSKSGNASKASKPARDLGLEMHEWAAIEMKFMPQGRHADKKLPDIETFRKLCRGKGREYWEYIIQHVKSAENVNNIQMNLALRSNAGGDTEEASRIQRRRELFLERERLRAKVEKQRTDVEKVEDELKKSEKDLSHLETQYQTQLRNTDDYHHHRLLLSAFNDKNSEDQKKLQVYQQKLSDHLNKYKQLLDQSTETQFYSRPKSLSDDGGLESACTKEVREASELMAKYLHEKPDEEEKAAVIQEQINQKISHIMDSYPGSQVLASVIEVTNETALEIQLQTQTINITNDITKLQFKQESNGDLTDLSQQPTIQQTVDQLIERSQLEHVLRFTAIQKHKNTVHNLDKQVLKTKQDCDLALQQNLGGLPDMLDLTKRVLDSETKLVGTQAELKTLHRLANELTQQHARIENEKSTLQQKYQRIQDFNKIAEGKQNLIKALVRQTRNTPPRLQQQKTEILTYIDQSLRTKRDDVTNLANLMSGTILNEMKIFSSISLQDLPLITIANMDRVARLQLSINKFRPEICPQNEELITSLENLDFPFYQAPELLLQRCIELQQSLSDYQRHQSARELPDCARTGSKMADVLAKVDRHDQLVKERILPKLEHCLRKTSESLGDCVGLKNLVTVWWDQPGQMVTPWVEVGGKTFQEYKDQWTILCTRLRQLQRTTE